jgi:putative endonuclease
MPERYVYILASKSGGLYVGVTSDLIRRMYEHKNKLIPGFTAKYNVNILVYYESFPTAPQAIEAEKKIKGSTRAKKVALIESRNRTWRDLSSDFTENPSSNVILSEAKDLGIGRNSRSGDPSLRSG